MIKRYHKHFSDAIELLENNDREAFIDRFKSVTNWMGDYSSLFLDESRVMLQQVHDNRHYEENKIRDFDRYLLQDQKRRLLTSFFFLVTVIT